MKKQLLLVLVFVLSIGLHAEDPTSRFLPLSPLASSLPASSTGNAVQFEVWDQAIGGSIISSEAHTVDTDAASNISNDTGLVDLLLGRPGGLVSANFPAGSSRYLDVTQGGSSVLTARLPLYASAFTISPGPQGPAGPPGPTGPQGPAGPVSSVAPGDASIVVAGSVSVPSVAVATNGITNAKVADGALSPAKVTGTAATLGANSFSGDQTVIGRVGIGTGSSLAAWVDVLPGSQVGQAPIAFRARGQGVAVVQGLTNAGGDGVQGVGCCLGSAGVHGVAQATSGAVALKADVGDSGGTLIIGNGPGGVRVFRVDFTGRTFANGGFQASGADFAESVAVEKEQSLYEPGDVLAIDPTADRRLKLASIPYSTQVAGIYSTKPGVLATPYQMDDPRIAQGVPLAVVGIVPCKVSAENGPIQRGDLLVISSTPGHAMKGTNRSRLVGAVVGKALERLPSGKGVIQVLVTLQ
jgi:hypothetical protein